MLINAEKLCTSMLEAARRRGELPKWIETAITFIQAQDRALKDARDGLRERLGVPEKPSNCLVRDDDGHWYVIPVSERARFDRWVELVGRGRDGSAEDWELFDGKCRLRGSPSMVQFGDWSYIGD